MATFTERIKPRKEFMLTPSPSRSLDNHIIHPKISPLCKKTLFCNRVCTVCASDTYNLKHHAQTVKHKNYCYKCNRTFRNIRGHLHRVHHAEIFCEKCPKNMGVFFSSKDEVIYHMQTIHTKKRKMGDGENNTYSIKDISTKDIKIRKYKGSEADVQKFLENKTGGYKENLSVGGFIWGIVDLVIHSEKIIIEIKEWKNWKHAIGQIVSYRNSYPNYNMMIYFFGDKPSQFLFNVIKKICNENEIAIGWKLEHIPNECN